MPELEKQTARHALAVSYSVHELDTEELLGGSVLIGEEDCWPVLEGFSFDFVSSSESFLIASWISWKSVKSFLILSILVKPPSILV